MKAIRFALSSSLLAMALTGVAVAQDSAQVTGHIKAARTIAGTEWPQVANLFCATEAQVAAMKILPSVNQGDVEGQRAEPMKVFDNLYFVGQKAVATWAIITSDGIILTDSGYPERFDDTLVAGLRKVGLDPARVRMSLITHEHSDHFGGARMLQDRFGTKIHMAKVGWDSLEPKPGAPPVTGQDAPPRRDMVIVDGQAITLGDTTVIPIAIPGHTAGAMGFIFQVKDGGRTHMAALFGGNMLSPQARIPTPMFQQYVNSLEHFAEVARKHKVEVEFLNHPIMDGLFEKLETLKTRKPGAPHPLVIGEASYQRFLGVMTECGKAQLARRQVPSASR